MWRIARPAFAGLLGLGLATLSGQRLGYEPDARTAADAPVTAEKVSETIAKAPAPLIQTGSVLAKSPDVRWLDPHDMGAGMKTPVNPGSAADAIALAMPGERPEINLGPVEAYAPLPEAQSPETKPPELQISTPLKLPPDPDLDSAREALKFTRAGDLAKADGIARSSTNETTKAMLEWAALRLQPRAAGFTRITSFMAANPEWPGIRQLERRAEEALFADKNRLAPVRNWFLTNQPVSPLGKLVQARALLADDRKKDATSLVAAIWCKEELGTALEANVKKEFGALLTAADHRCRADRLFYREKDAASLRAASYAGGETLALAKARQIAGTTAGDKLIAALPKPLQADPTLIFAKAQKLRRDNKFAEAAQTLLAAPREGSLLVDGDAWWVERRQLARKLLDTGDAKTAFRIASEHAAESAEMKIEAEFHAGWIALRFMDDAPTATQHFGAALAIAETPLSRSRAAYWLGRAAEAASDKDEARKNYETAAAYPNAYYGQLARARLGLKESELRLAAKVALGDVRMLAIRVVERLLAAGESRLALGFAVDIARTTKAEDQLAALAQTMIAAGDARGALAIGKLGVQRGFALDDAAFPLFGIPHFEPAVNSAEKPLVYAIARQESAFQADAVSSAGARGLMQMIASTARRTAQRVGVPFDFGRMTTDPAFNARLGAAHLGDLLVEHNGSMILTFAAYNAGGKRVKEWIAAYGDPRKPEVDPVDWVERIPFNETRNYVQRVSENLEMYRLRFGDTSQSLAGKDLRILASKF